MKRAVRGPVIRLKGAVFRMIRRKLDLTHREVAAAMWGGNPSPSQVRTIGHIETNIRTLRVDELHHLVAQYPEFDQIQATEVPTDETPRLVEVAAACKMVWHGIIRLGRALRRPS
jgi:hypothetical protein